jgi:hypothetical protein
MANQGRGERLRQFMQWRQQQGGGGGQGQFGGGGGRFGGFQGGMGQGPFGAGRFGRFQGGMGQGQFGGREGLAPENEDITAMDVEQRSRYRQQLEFRIDWLEKRLAQTTQALEELDALEAALPEAEEASEEGHIEVHGTVKTKEEAE